MTTVALMVNGHGFGHAVRCAEVARALLERGARVVVRSDAPSWLFPAQSECIGSPGWPLDVGAVQHSGLDIDIDATRARWTSFAAELDSRVDAEAALLRQHGVDVVLGDVPPLAFAAARRAGLPSAAMANFSWDWIYAAWPCFSSIVDRIRSHYAEAEVLLRLPLHSRDLDAFIGFRRVDDVPLVARHATRSRSDIRRELGLPTTARVVLLSFGAFDAHIDIGALGRWSDYVFVLTRPLANAARATPSNVSQLVEQPSDYVSLLAACDAVVTKPGYGIVSDCLANRVPVLFTDRGPFREYDVLVEALQRHGHARFVPRADVVSGTLGPHLDALLSTPPAWTTLRTDGAAVVAERLLSF